MTAPCTRFEDEAIEKLEAGEPLDEHFSTCLDCLRAREAHRKLSGALGSLEAGAPPADWQARVLRRIDARAAQRRRLRWAGAGAAGAMAIAAGLVVALRPPPPQRPRLELAVLEGSGPAQRAISPKPGDVLRAEAETGGARVYELRVYSNDRALLFRCPPGCTESGGRLRGEMTLPAPGVYQVVLLTAGSAIAAPGGDLAADTERAIRGGAESVLAAPVTVR